jgi:hypothetical protein
VLYQCIKCEEFSKEIAAVVVLFKEHHNRAIKLLKLRALLFIVGFFVSALYHVMQLCERLLLDHAHRLNGKANPLHKGIIFCLTAPSSSLRLRCRPVVKKLVSVLGGTQLARSLLKEFTIFLETAKIRSGEAVRENKDGSDIGPGGGVEITAKMAVNCITTFCSGSNLAPEDAQLLALDSLISCHHPAIGM